jgi:hypothetical protein
MRALICLTAVFVLGIPAQFHAQDTTIVRGFVTDAATGMPLPEATVAAVGGQLSSQTDAAGMFQLEGLPLGAVTLSVLRMGYSPIQFTVDLDEGGLYQIAAGRILLEPLPLQLDPVQVEAVPVSTRRLLAEFELRREASAGSFITREEFEKMGNPVLPTDVLRRMHGIRVLGNPNAMSGGSGPPFTYARWLVRMRRTANRASFQRVKELGGCPPLLFLDGRYMGTVDENDVDQVLSVNEVEAVEAYSSAATIPAEFNRTGSVCGVIAFWTR